MKALIDITKKIEEYIKDYIPIGAGDNVFCYPDEIVRMIQNGTPIPDNATNGGVMKAILNPYKICEYEYSIHIYMTEEDFWKADYQMNCNADWWNAPYQKGNEE